MKGLGVLAHMTYATPRQVGQAITRRNFEGEEDKYHQLRWCLDRLSHSQKCRVQRLRNLEEAKAQYLEMIRKALPDLAVKVHRTQEKESCPREKEWRLKPTKVDGTASTGTNMVFVLPP
jgi:hypothetical protein